MNSIEPRLPLLGGRANESATRAFSARVAAESTHFRAWRGLTLSSFGLGTYLGAEDEATDAAYFSVLRRALTRGLNVLDTAVNYRCQRSERVIGAALRAAIEAGEIEREQVLVCTKAGYLTGDGARPADPHTYFEQTYFQPGILRHEELVERSHSIAPRFLRDQLERSRRNLGLETLDVFYLHNPETQLKEVSRATFLSRIGAAFECLENAVAERKIARYGVATWDGLRCVADARAALSLEELLGAARSVAGDRHHFSALQVPLNLAMPEAYTALNHAGRSLLQAAAEADLLVTTSVPLLQGRLAGLELEFADSGLTTSAQHVLQLVRSTPGVSSAIVGIRQLQHLDEALVLTQVPSLPAEQAAALFDLS